MVPGIYVGIFSTFCEHDVLNEDLLFYSTVGNTL